MHFNFRDIDSRKDLKELIDFLIKQNLGYPNYEDWVQRTESELDLGYKAAIVAFSDGKLVGDLIHQSHKTISGYREVKNLRIHPELRRRDVAHFMLRQAEFESSRDHKFMICDVPTDQKSTIRFLRFCGYMPIKETPLYSDRPDLVMIKALNAERVKFI